MHALAVNFMKPKARFGCQSFKSWSLQSKETKAAKQQTLKRAHGACWPWEQACRLQVLTSWGEARQEPAGPARPVRLGCPARPARSAGPCSSSLNRSWTPRSHSLVQRPQLPHSDQRQPPAACPPWPPAGGGSGAPRSGLSLPSPRPLMLKPRGGETHMRPC
jgi:hypothetical protein